VIVFPFMSLALVELDSVHRLDVFAEGRGVRVALGAAGGSTGVGLLQEKEKI